MRRIRTLLRDRSGAAAVEFGLLLPIMGAMLIGVVDGATLLLKYNQMHTAISSGAQYVMAGGQDLTTAKTISVSAWKSPPANAEVTVTKTCKCGATATVCTTLCGDGTVPLAYISIASSGNVSGAAISTPISATQTIRVR